MLRVVEDRDSVHCMINHSCKLGMGVKGDTGGTWKAPRVRVNRLQRIPNESNLTTVKTR